MSNPIDDILNDPELNSSGVTDFAKRLRLWTLKEEHYEFQEKINELIALSDLPREKKTKMIMWLGMAADQEIDFMLNYPDDYLEIYDEQL